MKRSSRRVGSVRGPAAARVVSHLRAEIDRGVLRPGAPLPPERELAAELGVSRPTVRTALQSLSAMGVVQSRQGVGTFVREGPPTLDSLPLELMAILFGLTTGQLMEARATLEEAAAARAATAATHFQLEAIAADLAGMYSSVGEPDAFDMHDAGFHRAIAAASGNPVLASLIEMVSPSAPDAQPQPLCTSGLSARAGLHRPIFRALLRRDAEAARAAMRQHFCQRPDSSLACIGDRELTHLAPAS